MNNDKLIPKIVKVGSISLGIFILCVGLESAFNLGAFSWFVDPIGFFSIVSFVWMLIWFLVKYFDVDTRNFY